MGICASGGGGGEGTSGGGLFGGGGGKVVEDLEVDGLVEGEAMRVEVTVVVEVAVEEEETVAEEALTDILMQRIFAQ